MNQRDVYEVYFPFPDGQQTPHPVIVLSIPNVLNCESTFICVPISSSPNWKHDQFSFPLSDSDFDIGLKYESYARLHLITFVPTSELVNGRRLRTMNIDAFNEMFNQIQELIFGC
jgi:mRNA-degrading endonuclease toxin of MazEF toxin-antitoxin module